MPNLQHELFQYRHHSDKGRRNRYFLQARNIQAGMPPPKKKNLNFYALCGKLLKTYKQVSTTLCCCRPCIGLPLRKLTGFSTFRCVVNGGVVTEMRGNGRGLF